MWWPESSLILVLIKSKLYQRFLVCIYLIAFCMVILSAWEMVYKSLVAAALCFHAWRIIRQGIPNGKPMLLVYSAYQWTWRPILDAQVVPVKTVRLLLNAPIFILLRLELNEGRSQLIFIFQDQLTEDARRRLMWILI